MIYDSLVRGPYKSFPTNITKDNRFGYHDEIIAPAHGDGPASKTWDQYKVEFSNPVTKPAVTSYNRKSRLETLMKATRFPTAYSDVKQEKKEDEVKNESPQNFVVYEESDEYASDFSTIAPSKNPVYSIKKDLQRWQDRVYEKDFAIKIKNTLAKKDAKEKHPVTKKIKRKNK